MKRLLALLTPLFFLFMSVGTPAFAGSAPSTTHNQTVVQAQTTTQVTKSQTKHPIRNFFKKISDAKDMDINWLGFIIGIFIPIVTMWKFFDKNGIAGWWSLIPIGNTIKWLSIIDRKWTNIFWLLIPIVNIFFIFKWSIEMAKKFGKSGGFGIGLALLGPIFYGLLAWDNNVSGK